MGDPSDRDPIPTRRGTFLGSVADRTPHQMPARADHTHIGPKGIPSLHDLAVAIALAVEATVEPTGNEFMFTRTARALGMPPEQWPPINYFHADSDSRWINFRVPKPNDRVSIPECIEEWKRDCTAAHERLKDNQCLEDLIVIYTNQFYWCCFWAVRHPHPDCREFFRRALRDRGYEPLPLSIEAESEGYNA